jgi:hypothetical protein
VNNLQYPVQALDSDTLQTYDEQARQTVQSVTPSGANDNCKNLLQTVICARFFQKCLDDGKTLLMPCTTDCRAVDTACPNTTLAQSSFCAASNATNCNLVTQNGPNIALAILIPLAILGGLIVVCNKHSDMFKC